MGDLGQRAQAASDTLFKLLAKGFRAWWPGFAIEIQDDEARGIAMLSAEMGDGGYQPIVAAKLDPMRDVARGQQSVGYRELRVYAVAHCRTIHCSGATGDQAASHKKVWIAHTLATLRSECPP